MAINYFAIDGGLKNQLNFSNLKWLEIVQICRQGRYYWASFEMAAIKQIRCLQNETFSKCSSVILIAPFIKFSFHEFRLCREHKFKWGKFLICSNNKIHYIHLHIQLITAKFLVFLHILKFINFMAAPIKINSFVKLSH